MKNKNKVFRLSASEQSKLKKIAEKWGIDESKSIRRLIREGYNNIKGDKKMKAILTETHSSGEHNYKVEEVLLCRYVPAGTFDIKSINRPYDTVLINPQDNPLTSELKTLIDPDANGFESRTLEFNKEYYRRK